MRYAVTILSVLTKDTFHRAVDAKNPDHALELVESLMLKTLEVGEDEYRDNYRATAVRRKGGEAVS